MKRLLTVLLACLLIACFTAPASAIELNLQGTWLWGYDYVAQAGRAGFFGPYDFATPGSALTVGGFKFNSLNAWLGAMTINGVQYGLVTGTDGSLQWSRIELTPEIRLNKAVRFRAAYQIGANVGGVPFEYGLYANSTAFGAWNPIASGSWTQWWLTAQTPLGILIAGKRPFAWGMGAQYDGTSCTSESFGIVAPYGPLRLGIVIYPWRGQTWVNTFGWDSATFTRRYISTTATRGADFFEQNYRLWDNDRKRQLQPGVFITYQAGNIDTGIVYEWFSIHNGPGGGPSNTGALFSITADQALEDGSAYFKYNNGRFFLNAEVAWLR